MDELTARIAFAAVGLAIGLLLGWSSRAAHEARKARLGVTDDEPADTPKPRKRITRTDVGLGILILIAFASSLITWQINERVDRVATCTADIQARMVTAINERTSFQGRTLRATNQLWGAQVQLLSSEDITRAQLTEYRVRVREFIELQARTNEQRREHPYPTEEEIRRCQR